MKSVERSTRAELRALGVSLRSSALARSAVDLAKRLDGYPADSNAVLLARELRLVMSELYRRSGADVSNELERFLEQISSPAFRHPGN